MLLIVQMPVAPETTPAGIDPVDPPDVAEGILDELELPEPDEPLEPPELPVEGAAVVGVDELGTVVPVPPEAPLPPLAAGSYTADAVAPAVKVPFRY